MVSKSSSWKLGCAVLIALAAVGSAWAISPNIVLSQVYGGGGNAGAQYKNDFIELFNRGTAAVDITGWSVQYASTAGTTWQVTTLSGSLQPGQYYLIKEAGGTNGVDLPTPDATGTIPMAAANGKVALVNNSTALTGSCPLTSTVDFIGYGTANCFEGTAAAPGLSNTTADFRAGSGCTDTDQNSTDFAAAAPAPRNTASPLNPCGGPPTGACCHGSNLCSIETQTACTGLGGTYQGDGTTCDNNPCNYPTGACCLANGSCAVHTQQDCGTSGGTYQGDGTTCVGANGNPCIGDSTILQAKAGGTGKAVRLKNVIVSSTTDLIASANSKCFQLQDATAGITVFGSNADIDALLGQFVEGDKITLEGVTSQFNGLFELVAPFPYIVNSGQVGVPTPIVVTSTNFADGSPTAEGLESELVKVRCVTFGDTGNFAGQTNYTVTDPNGSFVVRISTGDLDMVGQPIPTGPVHITGIFSQNDTTAPYDGGYQLLPRSKADFVDAPECIPTGACCTGETCTVLTQAQCATAGGTYKGDGTGCTPSPCVGACCYQHNCTLQLQANCLSLGGEFLGYGTQCVPFVCPVLVQPGDIAFGLSTADATTTAEHVRAGAKIGSWPSQAYLQSMEFDNAGGTLHSAAGNLLALNYGAGAGTGLPPDCTDPNRPDQAGKLYNLATNGTNGSELLYDFRTGIACTRIGGLSVSPNNHYVALWGYDTSSLYVLAYDAGAAVGTGSGASITNAWSFAPTSSVAPGTEGTTWLDDDTILLYTVQFGTGLTDLSTVDFNAGVFTQTVRVSFDIGTTPASIFTDVEYNPTVSPYVFCMFSNRGGTPPATTNKLTAINPSDWSIVKQIDLSISLNTAREIALGPDKFLYISEYHSGTNVPYIGRLDATNPATWTDNSTTDYYLGDTYSPFNGLDVAFGPAGCRGDFNCDGLIDFRDIDPFVAVLSGGDCCDNTGYNCDVNGDGRVDFADIDPFVELLSSGATCP